MKNRKIEKMNFPETSRRPLATRLNYARQVRQAVGGPVRKHKPDYWLVALTVVLLAIGLTVVYSIGPALSATRGEGSASHYVIRQMIAIALSGVAFFVTSKIPLRIWRNWQWLLLGAALLGTLVALLTPVIPAYPAHRWIRLGGLSLQSVELVKFALLIATSGFLALQAKRGELSNNKQTLYPILGMLAIVAVLVAAIQSDLGSMGVIVAMVGMMAYVAGLPLKRLMLIGGAVVIAVILLVSSTPYRRARVVAYLNPSAHCQTTGYQACKALIAIGSGGVAGLGVGHGAQAYGYLPEAQNDSIFAIYAEKFGLFGSLLLLGIFGLLFSRMKNIAERAPTLFGRLVVIGVLAWLSVQTIINIGAMIGLLPLKGITLPLVSYGGTSVLFVGAALGLVFQISKYTSFSSRAVTPSEGRGGSHEDSSDRRRFRGAYHSNPGSRRRN